jgi:hypothetical protein
MTSATKKIWIWLHGTDLIKAVYNPVDRTLTIFDETDHLLLKRIGLSPEQAHQLATRLAIIGAKRLDGHDEPFTYL